MAATARRAGLSMLFDPVLGHAFIVGWMVGPRCSVFGRPLHAPLLAVNAPEFDTYQLAAVEMAGAVQLREILVSCLITLNELSTLKLNAGASDEKIIHQAKSFKGRDEPPGSDGNRSCDRSEGIAPLIGDPGTSAHGVSSIPAAAVRFDRQGSLRKLGARLQSSLVAATKLLRRNERLFRASG